MESCVPSDASRLGNDLCNGGRSSEALRNDTMTVDQLATRSQYVRSAAGERRGARTAPLQRGSEVAEKQLG
jgi:hypothetical protein